jgi:NADPH:quinone reductase-like Zn-dependent oxidoreductase
VKKRLPPPKPIANTPEFFSTDVAKARRFYLDLNPPKSRPLAVVCGGLEHCTPDYAIRREMFPYFSIEFVMRGRGEVKIRNRKYPLQAGSLFSYGPGIPHAITGRTSDPLVKYFVDFTGTQAPALLRSCGLHLGRVSAVVPSNTLQPLFDELIQVGLQVRREAFDSALGGSINGMLAEFVALSADGVIAIPPHLGFEEAATLPCAALTAWHALVTDGKVSAGQTVLVLGTGGVSIFALQFAKMHGARVIVTSSSDAKLARAKALGADDTINYKTTPDWEKEVFRLTDKAGADHVIEVGGNHTFPRSLRAVAMGGTISVIGGVSGFTSEVALRDILGKSALIRGIFVGSHDMFAAMNRAISQHRLKPVIDRVFPFAEAPAAYRHQESGAHFGKVVIAV